MPKHDYNDMKTDVERLWDWWNRSWISRYILPIWVKKTIWDLVLYYNTCERAKSLAGPPPER